MRNLGRIPTHVFSGLLLSRCEHERKSASWVEDQLQSPSASVMLFDRESILVSRREATCLHSMKEVQAAVNHADFMTDVVLLGCTTAATPVAVAAKQLDVRLIEESKAPFAERGWEWMGVRKYLMGAESDIVPLVGLGKSMTHWHSSTKHCSHCGGKAKIAEGGMCRVCTVCSETVYPRINPCAIMLVLDGQGHCLLGKAKGRPYHTTLAGFASHGECIEETVVREVFEEAGVGVSRVFYHSSQTWPFPCQLMLGFHALADASRTTIVMDPHEMEDVQWVPKEDVRLALEGKHAVLTVPQSMSIAHQLMKAWVEGDVTDTGAPAPHSSL